MTKAQNFQETSAQIHEEGERNVKFTTAEMVKQNHLNICHIFRGSCVNNFILQHIIHSISLVPEIKKNVFFHP